MSSYVLVLWLNLADFSLLAIMCYFLFGRPRALSFHISTSWSVTRSLWPSSESLWRSDQHFPHLHTFKRTLFNGSQKMVTSCQNWQMKVAEESLEAITDLSIGARRTPSVKEIKTSNKKMSPLFLKGTRCT